jgi:hypothetical protein
MVLIVGLVPRRGTVAKARPFLQSPCRNWRALFSEKIPFLARREPVSSAFVGLLNPRFVDRLACDLAYNRRNGVERVAFKAVIDENESLLVVLHDQDPKRGCTYGPHRVELIKPVVANEAGRKRFLREAYD